MQEKKKIQPRGVSVAVKSSHALSFVGVAVVAWRNKTPRSFVYAGTLLWLMNFLFPCNFRHVKKLKKRNIHKKFVILP